VSERDWDSDPMWRWRAAEEHDRAAIIEEVMACYGDDDDAIATLAAELFGPGY
jgi:hypothetical protein